MPIIKYNIVITSTAVTIGHLDLAILCVRLDYAEMPFNKKKAKQITYLPRLWTHLPFICIF